MKRGYAFAEDEKDADVILLNTCSVRDKAEPAVYSQPRQFKRSERKESQVDSWRPGLYGAKMRETGTSGRMPHVNLICGTRMFSKLPEFLGRNSLEPINASLLSMKTEK